MKTYDEMLDCALPQTYSRPDGYNGHRAMIHLALAEGELWEMTEHGYYRAAYSLEDKEFARYYALERGE